MALPKRIKQGGSYFKGYSLVIGTTAGDYVLNITTASAFQVNGVQLVPDDSGSGDYITVGHFADVGAGAAEEDRIADTLFNTGPLTPLGLAFPAIEPFKADEDLRVTYTNVGTLAINLNVYVEFIR